MQASIMSGFLRQPWPIWCILFLTLGTTVPARADGLGVSVGLSRSTVPFDSTVTLNVSLTWPGDQLAYRVLRPIHPEAERLTLLRYSSTASTTGTVDLPITTRTYEFIFQPTSAGVGKILPMTIVYRLASQSQADSTIGQTVTEPLTLTILEPEIQKSRSKTNSLIPYPLAYWLMGIVVLSGGFVIMLVVRARRPSASVISPEDSLLVKISELRAESGDDVKRFQTGVYKELVQYVARVCRLDLSGMMTEEIVHAIDSSTLPDVQKEKIGAWLLQAQRQKFSPAAFSSGEVLRLEQEIRAVFERPPSSTV